MQCARHAGQAARDPENPDLLPFDVVSAHQLWLRLFGRVDHLLRDKSLVIVPTGPLSTLPFGVLVTEPPEVTVTASPGVLSRVHWLGRRNAITVLPSVGSLYALRASQTKVTAQQPYIGFGNPLLTGQSGTDRRAWERQLCPSESRSQGAPAAVTGWAKAFARLFRGGLAQVEELRRQPPLDVADHHDASGVPARAAPAGSARSTPADRCAASPAEPAERSRVEARLGAA